MPDTYQPAALRLLASVVDRHCDAFQIVTEADRDSVAELAIRLYGRGVTGEVELLAALANHPGAKARAAFMKRALERQGTNPAPEH